jgi:hypothetical protein
MTDLNATNAAAAGRMESCDGIGCFETMLDTGCGILDEKPETFLSSIEHPVSSIGPP